MKVLQYCFELLEKTDVTTKIIKIHYITDVMKKAKEVQYLIIVLNINMHFSLIETAKNVRYLLQFHVVEDIVIY